jgi:AAA15 family ATPase/GTPase
VDVLANFVQKIDLSSLIEANMLIEFRVANFRSLRDTQTLSMIAGSGAEHRETHTFSPLPEFGALLASAALYGPNAAGKTNLLRALQTMQSIVINSASAKPTEPFPYSPFRFSPLSPSAPTEFEVAFIEDGIRYEYGFAFDATRIIRETLIEFRSKKPSRLFDRNYIPKSQEYKWNFAKSFRGNKSVLRAHTRPNALFLSTAVQLNNTQLVPAFLWFQKRLVTIVGATQLNVGLTVQLLSQGNGKERLLPFIQEADPGISDLLFAGEPLPPQVSLSADVLPLVYQDEPNGPPKIAKVKFSHPVKNTSDFVDLDLSEESGGTQMLLRTGGAWLNVLRNGEILLIDEIDTSLHPILVASLINRFHSDAANPQHAQLIFTTHNTSILTKRLFRRDQIWFIEKKQDNSSKVYPLSDFSPRKDEDIERWYMRGRYGALPILQDDLAQ